MQIPTRKPGKFTHIPTDYNITQAKYDELSQKLEKLKKKQPKAIKDVEQLALMGDFSENAAYQIAKGRLRTINYKIDEIQDFLQKAKLISKPNTNIVQLGSTVKIESNSIKKTFQILGSSEANPSKGIISQYSPLGKALIGRKQGDNIEIEQNGKIIEYRIVGIE